MSKVDHDAHTNHVRKMLDCAISNPNFLEDLSKTFSGLINNRGGKAKVTLKQAEEIDVEVSMIANEIVGELTE